MTLPGPYTERNVTWSILYLSWTLSVTFCTNTYSCHGDETCVRQPNGNVPHPPTVAKGWSKPSSLVPPQVRTLMQTGLNACSVIFRVGTFMQPLTSLQEKVFYWQFCCPITLHLLIHDTDDKRESKREKGWGGGYFNRLRRVWTPMYQHYKLSGLYGEVYGEE